MHPLIPYFEPFQIPLPGGLAIQGPGLMVVLAFVVGHAFVVLQARRERLDTVVPHRLLGWIVVAVAVGGHLGEMVFYQPATLARDPWILLRLWQGQSSYGGFLACGLVGLWFFRREIRRRAAAGLPPIEPWAYVDAELYGFTIGWAIARFGCFSVHDHPGVETRFWLGVEGICPGGPATAACHDMGLYEALWSLAAFLTFTWLLRRPRFPGFVAAALLATYGPSRFLADFLRHPLADARYLGLTPAQYGSVALFGLGLWIWRRQRTATPVRHRAVG